MPFLLISKAGASINGIYMWEDKLEGWDRYGRMLSVDNDTRVWLHLGIPGKWCFHGKREPYKGYEHVYYGWETFSGDVPLGQWPQDTAVYPLSEPGAPKLEPIDMMKLSNIKQLEYFGEIFNDNNEKVTFNFRNETDVFHFFFAFPEIHFGHIRPHKTYQNNFCKIPRSDILI